MKLELGHLIECLAAFQACQCLIEQTMSSRKSLSFYQPGSDEYLDEGWTYINHFLDCTVPVVNGLLYFMRWY